MATQSASQSISLCGLKMGAGKIATHVAKCPVDAWVVIAGSRPVLEWFASQPFPVFALMGNIQDLPIAGAKPDKMLAQREALHRLFALGHRRIVRVCRDEKKLHERLDNLFRYTPPTALFIPELPDFLAIQQDAARRGLFAPEKISLICDDPNPAFAMCEPAVSHITWNFEPITRRVAEWAKNVAKGKPDLRKASTKATFVDEGTIGPAPIR